MTVRQTQKAATRQRVLDAARMLFETEGYDETTVRAIAQAAGVSVGSVFTTFASKSDILSQMMDEWHQALYDELARVVPRLRGSTLDRLRSIFALHLASEAPRLRLFLTHIARAFDWTLAAERKPYGRALHLRGIIRDCLADGVNRGDVDGSADLDGFADVLMGAYTWVWRLAAWDGADAEAMTAAMDRQIALVVEGLLPRERNGRT